LLYVSLSETIDKPMIPFERFTLGNGLKVIVHQDATTPLVAMNILYNVGAKDEDPEKTGFAHLFEHLMFGGSLNIPSFDEPLEKAGGQNNAFTTNDITNYYLTVPKRNLETAFWLESDRMLGLPFSDKSIEVQKNVVMEEYKQRYLNQPYGDVWLLLRPLAYKVHPYQWSTIGKDLSHIEKATYEDVVSFYQKHYAPENAILVLAGDVSTREIEKLARQWFEPIQKPFTYRRNLPVEPPQTHARELEAERDVPFDAIYKAYHMAGRAEDNFYITDLLSDILSGGDSSRLYSKLVKEKPLFSEINAYVTGDFDEGLFIFAGKVLDGVNIQTAEAALMNEIEQISNEHVSPVELEKVKNKVEMSLQFSELKVADKSLTLTMFELFGDAAMADREIGKYRSVTRENLLEDAQKIFLPGNSSTLHYLAKK
jgi:zinc protease